ncbi:MAG: hypothetical protein ACRDRV_05445, partial [Pseudonocardiaceae bacterium]
ALMTTLLTRLRARPIPSIVAVVALLLAALSGMAAFMLKDNVTTSTEEVVNTAGGYSIQVPDGWTSTQDGRTTKVKSPEGDTLITFGLGRTGPLPVAATLFFQQVGGSYDKVQVFPPEGKKIRGKQALVYGGIGDNDKKERVRFLTISVENAPTNYGITVFTAAGSDPKTVLPEINRVVESFMKLPAR